MSKKARSLVFLGPSDGEKVLLCFKWGVLNYALECRLDGVQNHSRSRPYLCTRAFSDGVGWPSPLLHGREDFWVIIHFCCWVGILCVCFQVDIVLQQTQKELYRSKSQPHLIPCWNKQHYLCLCWLFQQGIKCGCDLLLYNSFCVCFVTFRPCLFIYVAFKMHFHRQPVDLRSSPLTHSSKLLSSYPLMHPSILGNRNLLKHWMSQ